MHRHHLRNHIHRIYNSSETTTTLLLHSCTRSITPPEFVTRLHLNQLFCPAVNTFFTTEPLPCDPSTLPVYPPSKEFDARYQEEEARKRKAEAMKGRLPESVRVADFRAQSKPQGQLVVRKYNPQERRAKKGFSYSNSEIHQSAVTSLTKNLKDDTLGTSLRVVLQHNDPALKGPMTNMHPVQESTKLDYATNKVTTGHAKRINRVYSGPLMPAGVSTDDMLKEHERHIQAAIRKARAAKAKSRLV